METIIYYTFVYFFFITGLMFGSFFTLAVYRIPRAQDIVSTRSYCPNCKHKLGFFDLIPVLSYVSTFGKCKYCKDKISVRYPITELLSGFVFVIIFLLFGLSIETLILLICYVYLYLIIGCDIMKSRMSEEEILEVKKIKNDKKIEKIKRKAGAINIEVIIAMFVLVFYLIVAVYITSNYAAKIELAKRRTEATILCTTVINAERAKTFNDVATWNYKWEYDNVPYTVNVTSSTYTNDEGRIIDNAKEITVNVNYSYRGKYYDYTLKTIKTEEL